LRTSDQSRGAHDTFLSVLYRFDGVDEGFDLLPLAARRALDATGVRLSRDSWRSLPVVLRKQIAVLGAARAVDVDLVREAVLSVEPPAEDIDVAEEPSEERPPLEVRSAFGPSRPLSDAVWSSLSPLDRYALAKIASRGNAERLHEAYAEIVGQTSVSTHIGPSGGARMVDVGAKPATFRRAVSRSEVTMSAAAFEMLRAGTVAKGDVLATARVAGILAAKRTPELIPLCHPIALSKVTVEFIFDDGARAVFVTATAEAFDRTGVEMESLTAVSVAALTIYDMLKSVDRGIVIGPTRLLEKTGGRNGDFSP
jgi:cyclic pyranopterin phosphate synthase